MKAKMKGKRWLLSIVSMALIVLVGSTVFTGSYFTDPEGSVDNTLCISTGSTTGWLTGWCYRVKITIDHNDFDEDATHFPVLVHLSSACGKGGAYDLTPVFDELGANSKRIAVTEDDGETQLYVEIEKWDETAEEAWLWVSRSGWTISSTVDTDIYLYYCNTQPENTSYVGDSGSRTEVWDSNFQGVWHLSETSGGGSATIAVDAVSSGTGDSSITIPHTTSGENRLMLVGIYADVEDPFSITSITYNGTSLQLVGFEQRNWLHVWIYKLVAPDTGPSNMVVNFSKTTYNRAAAGVMTFTGVDQDTPLGTFVGANNNSDNASVTVSSAEGELVFDTVGDRDEQATVGAGQTERWNIEATSRYCAGSTEPGAATVEMSWTFPSTNWAIGAVPIKPATTSGAVKDSTANANHGTESGDPTFGATGEIDGAIDFDGGDDYVDCGTKSSLDDLNSGLTVSAWIFPETAGGGSLGRVFEKRSDSAERKNFYLGAVDKEITWEIDTTGTSLMVRTSGQQLTYNTWHHVVMTWTGGLDASADVHIYEDGVESGYGLQTDGTGTIESEADGNLYIANRPAEDRGFDGTIDEVRISDSVRNAAWIEATYETQIDDMLDFGSVEGEEVEAGWLTGWCYRVKITIDHNDFDEDATHFPVLVHLSDACGIGNAYDLTPVFDELGANSKRIAVTEDDGETQLYVEIEKWDETAEEAWLWVSKSDWTISSIVDTDIYLYYCNSQDDNTTYVGNSGSRTEVWNSNFKGVYHLSETAQTGTNLLTYDSKYVVTSTTPVSTTSTSLVDDTEASQTFDLSASKTVLAIYQQNNNEGETQTYTGKQSAIYVDGTDHANTWDSPYNPGSVHATRTTSFWVGTLGAGPHTIKGRFASNSGSTSTISNRVLLIYILNGDAFYYIDDDTQSQSSVGTWFDDPYASVTFTPSGNCTTLILYNCGNAPGTTENEAGKKAAIKVGTTSYSQAEKSPSDADYADSVFTCHVQSMTATSYTVKGRFTRTIAGTVTISRRQLAVLLFADTTLFNYVTSDTQASTTGTPFANDPEATINRTTTDTRDLLVVAMSTKRDNTGSHAYGSAYGIMVNDVDHTHSRGSPHAYLYANSASTAWAQTLSAGSHTIRGRFCSNVADEPAIIDSRRVIALWLLRPPIKDSTSNANHGTDSGGPTFGATGEIDGAIDFDGDDDYVDVGDIGIDLENDFSISAWMKFDTVSDERQAVGIGDSSAGSRLAFGHYSDGKFRVLFREDDNTNVVNIYNSGSELDDNKFYYCVFVFNISGNSYTAYVDGSSITSQAPASYTSISSDKMVIGSAYVSGSISGYFNGLIDEVRVSDTARSAAWVKASYENERDDLLTFNSVEEEEAGWLTGWCYRVKITIDHNDFDEDVTHFPVLIHLSDACGIGNAHDLTPVFDEVGGNSKKIAVTEDDGTTQLYVEIEKWDETAEEAWLWVSKSGWTISSTVDTDIYLYYCNSQPDNDTYVGDSGSRTEVWDSDYQAVWHLSETGSGNATIAVDAVSVDDGGSPLTISHTTGSGSNRLMLVGISGFYAPDEPVISSIEYNGDNLTLVDTQAGSSMKMCIYKLVAPDTGTHNLVITYSGASAIIAGVMTFTGVDQSTPLGTFASAGGSSTTASVDVSSAAGELVFDTVAAVRALTVGPGQTQRWNQQMGSARGGGSTEDGDTTVNMLWSLDSSGSWVIGAVPIKPASLPPDEAKDSTSNANHGTPSGGTTFGATGEIDGAVDFDTNGQLSAGDPGDGNLDFGTGSFTVSTWINIDVNPPEDLQMPLYKGGVDVDIPGYAYGFYPTDIVFSISDGVGNYVNSQDVSLSPYGTWYNIVGVCNRTDDKLHIYKNGIEQGTASDISSVGSVDSSLAFTFPTDDWEFYGLLDEVRVSDSARSAAWVKATYETQIDDMLTFDSVEEEEGGEEAGWLTGWCKRVKITIDHNDFDEDATHFPVLVHLSSACGIGNAYDLTPVFDEVGANSKRIAVTEDDGTTQLYVEIEKWDETAEEAWLWVSRSGWTISSTVDTDIYLYYCNSQPDNDTYVGDSGSRTEVWDDNFKAVYHLSETSSSIAIDAVSNGTGTGDNITVEHTTSGTNRLMLVGISIDQTGLTVTSVTYNDVPLTLVGWTNTGDWENVAIYRLITPDTGTHNVVATYSQTGPTIVGVMTFTGVDQTTPLGTYVHNTAGASVDVSSATGELVFDTVMAWSSPTVGAGQTQRWNTSVSGAYGAGSTEPGATTVTMSWSAGECIAAVPIKPAPIKDSTSNANHGTDSGSPTFGATGEIDGAIDFHFATHDFVDCENDTSLDIATNIALEAFVKADSLGDYNWIVAKRDQGVSPRANYELDVQGDEVRFCFDNPTNDWNVWRTSAANLTIDTWYYITATYDGTTAKIYVNGVLKAGSWVDGSAKTPLLNTAAAYIAAIGGYTGYEWDGTIDEVRISDSLRSAAWIKASYENERDDLLDFGSVEEEEGGEEVGWLTGWCKRVKITIDHNDFDEDATHFPVLVHLSDACGIGNAYDLTPVFDEVGANSKRIAVTEDDGETQLYVEIEKWDETAEEAWLWVSRSGWTISSATDTDIYLYYCNSQPDNTTYVGDSGSRTEVWDSNFKGVWHLGETGGGSGSWLSDWAKRVKITIDSADIDENLTHFPVLVHLSGTCGKGSAYDMTPVFDEVGANSKRIAVTEDDGTTQLYVEIEKWDETAEEAWLWVSRSGWTILSATDTDIYLYYDNSQPDNTTYVGDSGSRTEVWDDNFQAVWHLSETSGGTDAIKDSTSNNNDGTDSGSPGFGATGKVGNAIEFYGTDECISLGNSTFDITTLMTAEAWFRRDVDTSGLTVIVKSSASLEANPNAQPFYIKNDGTNQMHFEIHRGTAGMYDTEFNADSFPSGTSFHYVALMANSSTSAWEVYDDGDLTENGALDGSGNLYSYTAAPTLIGAHNGYGSNFGFWDGIIDEVRISNTARSAAWTAACYETQIDDLLDFGSGETPAAAVLDSTANNNDGNDYGSPTFEATGQINGAIGFDGDDDYLDVSSMNPQSYDDFTVSAWYKASHSAVVDDEYIFSHLIDYADGPGIVLSITDDSSYADYLRVSIYDNSTNFTPYYGTSDVVDQQFHYVVGTRGGGRIKIYVDGANETDAADVDTGETINVDAPSGPHIGDLPGDTEQLYGILDEVRISDTARNTAWIDASYESERDDLLDFGSEETP